MDPGYYWYQSVEGDPDRFDLGKWEVIEIAMLDTWSNDAGVAAQVRHFGDPWVYMPDQLHGRFVGPIAPPF